MARPARQEQTGSARSSRQLIRFYRSINPDRVFGTHNTRLTGNAGGWNSSNRVTKDPHFRAAWKWCARATVIPMPAHAASHAASALLTTSRGCIGTATGVLSTTNVQTSGDAIAG